MSHIWYKLTYFLKKKINNFKLCWNSFSWGQALLRAECCIYFKLTISPFFGRWRRIFFCIHRRNWVNWWKHKSCRYRGRNNWSSWSFNHRTKPIQNPVTQELWDSPNKLMSISVQGSITVSYTLCILFESGPHQEKRFFSDLSFKTQLSKKSTWFLFNFYLCLE